MKKVCPVCKAEYGGGEVFCPVDAARLVTPSQMQGESERDDPLVGASFDKYEIKRRIGEGGMGLVYEAVHTVIEKRVAIKVLREDFSRRPEVVERFRQEAKSASRIGHENIVDISDFGTTPHGQSYFVMEYLDGEDLANVLARERTLPPERTVNILLQCCHALGAAHAKGIVHRDMKPENIFLVERPGRPDFVKIVDFGIAKMANIETDGEPGRKLTKTGMIFGTPEYMSPEQAAGKPLDHRVDVYAIGVILFECLTGRVPFVGDSFMGVLTQHMFEEPPPLREVNPELECSPELEMVVAKALAKDPDERYQTMDELAEAIREAMAGRVSHATRLGYGEPVKARAGGPRTVPALDAGDEFPSPASGRGGRVAMAAVLLVALGAGGAWLAFRPGEPERPPAPSPVAGAPDPAVGQAEVPADPAQGGEAEGARESPEEATEDPASPEPSMVPVTVETRPGGGAEVTVEGGEVQGCEPTPCTFEAPVGEELVIHARRDRSRGEVTLTPTSASTVLIVLEPQRARGMRRRGADRGMRGSATRMSSGPSELKVPAIFQ